MCRLNRPTQLSLLAATLAAALSGCASSPAPAERGEAPAAPQAAPATAPKPAEQAAKPSSESPRAAAPAVPVATTTRAALAEHEDPASALAKRSVYFDFDRFEIRADQQGLVNQHASYLNRMKDLKIQIQGNADERGSREYNLALGQKRADAVGRMLNTLGVPAARIETVSYGEEKPKAQGHDEASWSENRRGDLAYGSQPPNAARPAK